MKPDKMALSQGPEPLGLRAVLRLQPMRRLWYAQVVSVFGDFLILFAIVAILTFELHATPQTITGVQIAYLLPIAILGPISGVFADRWQPKAILVTSDLLRAALCLLMFRVHGSWGFYEILAGISLFSSLFYPAQGIAVRQFVPAHGLRSANSLLQQVMFVMRIVGGPIATLIVTHLSARTCYALDACTFLGSAALIGTLRFKPASQGIPRTQGRGVTSVITEMREGASFIIHHATLCFVILAMAGALFVMGCFGPLIALFVRDTLHRSTSVFGLMSAMLGLGLLSGVTILGGFAKRASNVVLVSSGLAGMSLGMLLMAAVPDILIAACACLMIGFSAGGVIVPAQTAVQVETGVGLLGRVTATVTSITFAAQIAGLVLSGVLLEVMTTREVFLVCGVLMALLAIAGVTECPKRDRRAMQSA